MTLVDAPAPPYVEHRFVDIESVDRVSIVLPLHPLRKGSLQITTKEPKAITRWTEEEHTFTLTAAKHITSLW